MTPARVASIFLALLVGTVLPACGGGGGGTTPAQPAQPQGVTATAADGTVTVQWQVVPGASSYNLYWSTSPGVSPSTGTAIQGVASPYVHGGRTNGTAYHYVVTAVSDAGEGAPSAEVSATPGLPAGVWDVSSWGHALWAP